MKTIPGLILFLSTTTLIASGCAGVVVGGAATGVAVTHDRRTPGTVINDQTMEWKLGQAIHADKEIAEQTHINITVYNKRILLTGEAPTEDLKIRANAIAAQTVTDTTIYNEIRLASPSSILARSNDTFITAKVKTSLLDIKIDNFDVTRVKVVTEAGQVYLMGLVTTQEAEAVTDKARIVSGVTKVIRLFEIITP